MKEKKAADSAMTNNILRMPYVVKPRQWIEKLIEIGLLQRSKRHDVRAVENALEVLRQRSRKKQEGDEEPTF